MRVTICAYALVRVVKAAENTLRMETRVEMERRKRRAEQTTARRIYATAGPVPLNRSSVVSSGTSSVFASPPRAKYRSFLQLSVLSDTHSSLWLYHINCGDGPRSGAVRWRTTQCRRAPRATVVPRRRSGKAQRFSRLVGQQSALRRWHFSCSASSSLGEAR